MCDTETVNLDVKQKPNISDADLIKLAEKLYGLEVSQLSPLDGYDDCNYWIQGENMRNPYEGELWPHGYVFKIMNEIDSLNETIMEAQNEIMLHLNNLRFDVPKPVKNIYGNYYSLELIEKENSRKLSKHIVRLLTFQIGTLLKDVTPSPNLYYSVGCYLGDLNEALKKITSTALMNHRFLWHLRSVIKLKELTHIVEDKCKRTLVVSVVTEFEEKVLPQENRLEKGIIHGDFNQHNILVQGDKVVSLIDYGDAHYAPVLFEIAICMAYLLLQAQNIEMGKHLLAGIRTKRKLVDLEIKLLKVCICARLCQSLVLGLHTYYQNPRNEYVLSSQDNGWQLLESLSKIEEEELISMWGLK